MKKIIFFLIALSFSLSWAYAAEEEVSPAAETTITPTTAVTDKIQELKEKVASRVAALKKEKMQGISGTVKSVSETVLILLKEDTEYSIQFDEDTIAYAIDINLRKKEIKLSDTEKDNYVTVIGVINTQEKSGTARLVIEKEPNTVLVGKVDNVSTKDGTITVGGTDNKTYTVDIEVTTKNNLYDSTKETLAKIGLSKIEAGSYIHVYGIKGKEENRVTAARILILPREATAKEEPTPTVQVTPTTTPAKKATATLKPTTSKTPTPTKSE